VADRVPVERRQQLIVFRHRPPILCDGSRPPLSRGTRGAGGDVVDVPSYDCRLEAKWLSTMASAHNNSCPAWGSRQIGVAHSMSPSEARKAALIAGRERQIKARGESGFSVQMVFLLQAKL
jgi:hypothetical protein